MENQYPYTASTLTLDAQQLTEGDTLYVELGPSETSPEVTLTVANANSVSNTWIGAAQAFHQPNELPLSVTIVQEAATGGTETKKIKLIFKPHGGLPGESPV